MGLKEFDKRFGFQNKDVLKLELEGNCFIKNTMSMMWGAINSSTGEASPFERYVFNEISESYRRVYQSSTKDKYCKYQLLCDAVSGMTEGYLVKKHNEFRELLNASTST